MAVLVAVRVCSCRETWFMEGSVEVLSLFHKELT